MDPIEGTFSGDEGQALEARMAQPRGVEVVGDTVYVADRDNKSVRRIKDGKMTSVAGPSVRRWMRSTGQGEAEEAGDWSLGIVD